MFHRCGEATRVGLCDVIPDGRTYFHDGGPLTGHLRDHGQDVEMKMAEAVAQRIMALDLPDDKAELAFTPALNFPSAAMGAFRQTPQSAP